ncbi:hypothetical protein NDU88_000446 [Pleurodeles waltl]|uniref:Uncharacterized protein n=1 Tax=Pleurodeles waltl TaxID=8319 RepID=A0AAV7US99_PLEWA|nr:hypothetical protein NDU88_000446 [Pleurodeles waltl]
MQVWSGPRTPGRSDGGTKCGRPDAEERGIWGCVNGYGGSQWEAWRSGCTGKGFGGALPGDLAETMDELDYDEDSMEEGELREELEDDWWSTGGVSNPFIKLFQTPAQDSGQQGQIRRRTPERPPVLKAGKKHSAVRTGAISVAVKAKVGATQDRLYKGVYVADVGVGPQQGEGGLEEYRTWDDIDFGRDHLVVRIGSSKTDQQGFEAWIILAAYPESDVCPVRWEQELKRTIWERGSGLGPEVQFLYIWVVGHSFIKWAQRQAQRTAIGDNLGMDRDRYRVKWAGKGGMK